MHRPVLALLAVFASIVGTTLCAVAPAFAQPAQGQHDLAAPARWAVNQVLYASTATSAAGERALDARINAQRLAIEGLRQRLGEAGGRNETLAAELSVAQERYVADLSEQERAYAQEIAVLRGAAEDIASTSTGLAALERFNAGDELGALLALDQMREARQRARQIRDNIESAAEARDIAVLASEARNRGKLDTAAVIARYEEVTHLDSEVPSDWSSLGQLYSDYGDLSLARLATERAVRLATDDNDRILALFILAQILVDQEELAEARTRTEESLAIARRVAQEGAVSPRCPPSGLVRQIGVVE